MKVAFLCRQLHELWRGSIAKMKSIGERVSLAKAS
jgi:hypothetical protein